LREAMPLQMGDAFQDIKVHHSSIVRFVVHSGVWMVKILFQFLTIPQSLLVYLQ
jgi:hypothetical protein